MGLILTLCLLHRTTQAISGPIRGRHHELLPLVLENDQSRVTVLDFELFADEVNYQNFSGLPVQIGNHNFQCLLPKGDVPETARLPGVDWKPQLAHWLIEREKVNWLTLSKLSPYLGSCLWHNPGQENADWRYSVCIGREIVKYKPPRLLARPGHTLYHMGYHEPERDEVYMNGSMTQHYLPPPDGSSKLSASVTFICGGTTAEIVSTKEEADHLHVQIQAPQFCDWRSSAENRPHLDRLIIDGAGICQNFTNEWWTYEYCHPDSLLQFHLERNNSIVNPMFLLGSLASQPLREKIDGVPDGFRLPEASPLFPFMRSTHMPKRKDMLAALPSILRDLPVEIIPIPIVLLSTGGMGFWLREAGALGLALYLNRGSPCPDLPSGVRSARIIFMCPTNMASGQTLRLVTVHETRRCTYDVLIEHAAVCAHPLLRPPFPELPESILCLRKRNELKQDLTPRTVATNTLADIMRKWDAQTETSHSASRTLREARTPPLVSVRGDMTELAHALNWLPIAAGTELALQTMLNKTAFTPKDARMAQRGRPIGLEVFEELPRVYSSGFYGTSNDTTYKSRRMPLFAKGDLVRHSRLGYTATVLAVDQTKLATESWHNIWQPVWQIDASYSDSLRDEPWYRLKVDLGDQTRLQTEEGDVREAYVPESFLRLSGAISK